MSRRIVQIPQLTDDQILHIANIMAKDQKLAYGIYDESTADQKWEEISCHDLFGSIDSGEILKASWEAAVDQVYSKQFEIMRTGKGKLDSNESIILSVVTEQELINTADIESVDDPNLRKQTKIAYQKEGLKMITDGNKTLEKFMYNMISWSNGHNRVLASGFRRANSNTKQLIEQIQLLEQRKKRSNKKTD